MSAWLAAAARCSNSEVPLRRCRSSFLTRIRWFSSRMIDSPYATWRLRMRGCATLMRTFACLRVGSLSVHAIGCFVLWARSERGTLHHGIADVVHIASSKGASQHAFALSTRDGCRRSPGTRCPRSLAATAACCRCLLYNAHAGAHTGHRRARTRDYARARRCKAHVTEEPCLYCIILSYYYFILSYYIYS